MSSGLAEAALMMQITLLTTMRVSPIIYTCSGSRRCQRPDSSGCYCLELSIELNKIQTNKTTSCQLSLRMHYHVQVQTVSQPTLSH
ncbi:hypothetical protein THAOC_32647 [Thalassiosira oceanica]|uniref:Uncharacterized protein n=1 Tax=Thalassiosira oceanica TaxID=159749 RepID=K0RP82_THAOC|nr:hypothetical protein THAOC_32647 [Thalassiosira oceanica]|eukprot:EJK48547.1 hypothetical protein THAOC_32647 [Thalassiosira oceanica]